MKKNKGFTLVELLAVIVILALIIVLVAPAVLNVLNDSKKEAFYMYAESLQTKALNQYLDDEKKEINENKNCFVYKLQPGNPKDNEDGSLGISSTGNYDGWVKIERTPTSTGSKTCSIRLQSSNNIEYAKYCIVEGNGACKPDKSFSTDKNSKAVVVKKSLEKGYTMCANAQAVVNDTITWIGQDVCTNFDNDNCEYENDGYEYVFKMLLTNGSYNFNDTFGKMSDDESKTSGMSKENFYESIKNTSSIEMEPCHGENLKLNVKAPETTIVSTTTSQKETTTITVSKDYRIILNTLSDVKMDSINQSVGSENNQTIEEPTRSGYEFAGWFYDIEYTKPAPNNTNNIEPQEKRDSAGNIIGYKDITIYAKWLKNGQTVEVDPIYVVTTTQPSEVVTEVVTTTTTVDVSDTSILLNNLNISGYNINFNPLKFYYDLEVPNDVTNLGVSANPAVDTTTVNITGGEALSVGINRIIVQLVSGTTNKSSIYTVEVHRLNSNGERVTTTEPTTTPYKTEEGKPDPTIEASDASLSNIVISGYVFNFHSEIYEYDLEVRNLNDLYVDARPKNKQAIVAIYGNDKVKDGGEVKIVVTSQNGYYTKTYRIHLKVKNTDSNSTKILRGITIGLILILVLFLIIIQSNKKKMKFSKNKTQQQNPSENIQTPTPINNQGEQVETISQDNNNQNNM